MVQLLGDCCEVYVLRNDLCCTVATEDRTRQAQDIWLRLRLMDTLVLSSVVFQIRPKVLCLLQAPTEGSGNSPNRARDQWWGQDRKTGLTRTGTLLHRGRRLDFMVAGAWEDWGTGQNSLVTAVRQLCGKTSMCSRAECLWPSDGVETLPIYMGPG